jgi:Protein of unknown function (DUF1572)
VWEPEKEKSMTTSWFADHKTALVAGYTAQKQMADAALARCDERMFFAQLRADGDDHTNSIAILVKHISGNFHSRWTDFLTSDGEKPDRQRPREFMHEEQEDRAQIMQRWESAWQLALQTLTDLTEDDFARAVQINGKPWTVSGAIQSNLLHAAHHVGQIELLATVLK